MTKRLSPLLAGALALLPACGHKGDPLPPLRRTPPPLTSFRLAQRGDALELQATAPAASVDGVAYASGGVEFLHATGQADLEKAGRRQAVRVAAGARATLTLPLPPPGTLVRAAARGLEGGEHGPRTLTMALVAQPPVEAPRELTAVLGEAGIELAWKGARPKEVAPPVGPKPAALPGRPGSTGPADAATTPGPATAPVPAASLPGAAAAPAAATPAAPEKPADARTVQAPPARRSGFFVYRRAKSGAYAAPLGEEPLDRRSFRDESAALGATWCYVVRAVASNEPRIESAPSNEACAERRDVTPPAAPAGLAVLPRQGALELLWSPSGEEDLAGYRVYRAAMGKAPERLAELAPARAAYLDESAASGVVYRYSLTAFDQTGNESPATDPVEATLP